MTTTLKPQSYWDISFAAAGLLSIAFTFHAYHFWGNSGRAVSRTSYSSAEATLRIESDKAMLATHPDDLDALTDLAIAHYQKGRDSYVDAMNALEKARSLGATNESLFFYAGVMYDALGLPDYAANEFAKYLRHYPNDYETMVRLANADAEQDKNDEALALYQQALKYWPNDPTAWFNLAVVNVKKGNADAAASALQHAKELAGTLPMGGHFIEGEISRLKGNDDAAMASYQQEIAKNPQYLPALEALETIQKNKKQWKDAQVTQKKIQELKHPPIIVSPPAVVALPAPTAAVAPAASAAPAVPDVPATPAVPAAPVADNGSKS